MIWISLSKAAQFYGTSDRTIRRWIAGGKCTSRDISVRGGTTSEICLTGEDAVRYMAGTTGADHTEITEQVNDSLSLLASLKGWQQEYVSEWVVILKATEGMTSTQIIAYVASYQPISPKVKLSRGTIYRNRAKYVEHGISGLVPGWGNTSERTVKTEWLNRFAQFWLNQSRPSAESCREMVFGELLKANPDLDIATFPHAVSFVRKLTEKIGKSAVTYARYGEAVWNRECGTYIPRDWTTVPAGSWWVSDHHQLDVLVVDKFGRTGRPWVTVWMDMRSMKFLSAYLHMDAPHSDHVFQSFAWAVEEHTLPDGIYLDNGKDYLVHDFTGGKGRHSVWKEDAAVQRARSIMGICEIEVKFATEYNAQAKHIEPRFKRVCKDFAAFLPGYTSNNMVNRPTEKLAAEFKAKKILPFEEVEQYFSEWVMDSYNHKPSKGNILKGLSPNQSWNQHRSTTRKTLSDDSMPLLYMRGTETRISRGFIIDKSLGKLELYYASEQFANLEGVKVYMRRDMRAWQTAYIFDAETHKFICVATMKNKVSGIAVDINKNDLKEGIERKKHNLKQVRNVVRDAIGEEPVAPRELLEFRKFAVQKLESANAHIVDDSASVTEIVTIKTELDKAAYAIQKIDSYRSISESEIADMLPEDSSDDDSELDLWGCNSMAL